MVKSIWKDPVWSKVISVAILAAVASAWAYFEHLWPTIVRLFTSAWSVAERPSPLPNWGVWCLAILALPTVLFGLAIVAAAIWPKSRQTSTAPATWRDYTQDVFYGLRWRWRYSAERVRELATFCPHCDYQVFPRDIGAYTVLPRIRFQCDSCNQDLGTFEESADSLESKVERLVQQNLRNGGWESVVLSQSNSA